jgi:hypothetical protein
MALSCPQSSQIVFAGSASDFICRIAPDAGLLRSDESRATAEDCGDRCTIKSAQLPRPGIGQLAITPDDRIVASAGWDCQYVFFLRVPFQTMRKKR